MEDGYHVNVARNTERKAWDSTPQKPRYDSHHYCAIFLGRVSREEAIDMTRDLQQRFPEGDEPGQFHLSLTFWQATGHGIKL
jgi:hypothetical protein